MNPDPPTHDDAQDDNLRDLRRRVGDLEVSRRPQLPNDQFVPHVTPERYLEALENQLPELVTKAVDESGDVIALRALLAEYADDLAFARRKRLEDEHAAWAWQQIKKHAPWVSTLAAMFAAAIGYLATHSINVSGKP